MFYESESCSGQLLWQFGTQLDYIFKQYFVNVGPNLSASILPCDTIVNLNLSASIFLHLTDVSEVLKIITDFKENAAGHDGIKAKVVKAVGQSNAGPLTHIINLSFEQDICPSSFKDTVVCPIHKGN